MLLWKNGWNFCCPPERRSSGMQEDFKSLKPEQLEALKQLLGETDNVQPPDVSDWFDGKQIDEIDFGEYLLRKKERKCIYGKLYDLDR